jgi:membrane protease YdiL (CAAX protease family)
MSGPADAGFEPAAFPDEPVPLTALVWPLRYAVALVLAVAGINLIASRVLRSMPTSGLDASTIALVILATFVAAYGVELGIVAVVARQSDADFAESVGLRRTPGMLRWIAIAFASAFGLRLVATAYAGFLFAMRWRLPGWDSNPMKYFPRTTLGMAALVFIVVIGAPIVEETVFRGVLLPSLAGRVGERWATGITTVVFAAMHLNAFSFAPILLVGWTLATLFLRSRSLWVSIACHSAFNGLGVLAVLLVRGNGVV